MRFYDIEIELEELDEEEMEADGKSTARSTMIRGKLNEEVANAVCKECTSIDSKIGNKGYFFMYGYIARVLNMGLIAVGDIEACELVETFVKKSKFKVSETTIEETSYLTMYYDMLQGAEHKQPARVIMRRYGMCDLENRKGFISVSQDRLEFNDMIAVKYKKDEVYSAIADYYSAENLVEELDRIYEGCDYDGNYGHPVHYIIETDDDKMRDRVAEALVQALLGAGRVKNQRYSTVKLEPDMRLDVARCEGLYSLAKGGTVVLEFCKSAQDEEGSVSYAKYTYIEDLGRIIRRNCLDVQTIICLPMDSKRIKERLYESTPRCTYVEIREGLADVAQAIKYLKKRAKEHRIRTDKALLSCVKEGHTYLMPELNEFFDIWYAAKLKTTVYKQYKDMSEAKAYVKKRAAEGAGFAELESMIGLEKVKKLVQNAVDSCKAEHILKDKGLPEYTEGERGSLSRSPRGSRA